MAKELLLGLKQLRSTNVMHCDLKPENIVFTDKNCNHVKIIDFGSACDSLIKGYTYLQSRAYRSPEVAMGIPITPAIDMWSLGCILSELDTRRVLFQAKDELELLTIIRLKIGDIPQEMINNCRRKKDYFDPNGKLFKSEHT
jgi:serine/threonine protein kinase